MSSYNKYLNICYDIMSKVLNLKRENLKLKKQNKLLIKSINNLRNIFNNKIIEFNNTPVIKNINNLCEYWFITAKNLLHLDWICPDFQRPVDEDRVMEIKKHYMTKYKEKGIFEFISPLIFSKYNNKLYIMDGQHRLEAIIQLVSNNDLFNKIDKIIPIIVIQITSTSEMEDLFQTLNKLLPLSEVYKIGNKTKKNIIVKTSSYFFKKYKYFFTIKRPRRPFINKNDFQNYLLNNNIIKKLHIHNENELISCIEKLNTHYKNKSKNEEIFPKKGYADITSIINKVQSKGDFYLGMFPKFEWIDHLLDKSYNK